MTRPITPGLHGAIDYGFFAATLVIPQVLKLSGRARAFFGLFGATEGTLNAFTDQPLALRPVISFRTHGAIDKGSSPVYFIAPLLLGLHKEPRSRAVWLGLGATLVLNYIFTDWSAPTGRRRKGRRGLWK